MTNTNFTSTRARFGADAPRDARFNLLPGRAVAGQAPGTHVTIPLRRHRAVRQDSLSGHSWARKALAAGSVSIFLLLVVSVVPGLLGWGALSVTAADNALGPRSLAIVRDSSFRATRAGDSVAFQTAAGVAVGQVTAVAPSGSLTVTYAGAGAGSAGTAQISEFQWLGSVSATFSGAGWIAQMLGNSMFPWALTVGQIVIVLALLGLRRSNREPRVSVAT